MTATVSARNDIGDLALNAALWAGHLRAANLSPATITTYQQSVARLTEFLERRGMPRDVAGIHREHVEAFIEELLARSTVATASNRFGGLQPFFRWLVDEGEIRESPMARMRRPVVPADPPAVPTDADLRAILAAAAGTSFDQRRDTALVRAFLGSGARLAEIAELRIDEASSIDLEAGVLRVTGKGRRTRAIHVGAEGAAAIRRYLRARARHPWAGLPWLWLGAKGRLTASGIAQAIRRRGLEAGIRIHAHAFRHAWAHAMLGAGTSEGDVMTLGGWRTRAMLDRYGAAGRQDRALAAAARFNPGDRL